MSEKQIPEWNRRSFTSLLMTAAFLVMTVSGFVLFVTPSGRAARESGWQVIGQSRETWNAVHLVFSVLFLVASVLHLSLNWRTMCNHFLQRQGRRTRVAEICTTLLVAGLVYAATAWRLPPVSWLLDWRQDFKSCRGEERQGGGGNGGGGRGWQRERSAPPAQAASQPGESPRRGQGQGGMGQLTLREFCRQKQLNLDDVRNDLSRDGVAVEPEMTMRSIAERKNLHPRDLIQSLTGE
jgi:succinate dehydrogenase hydrophobic anchor subunit